MVDRYKTDNVRKIIVESHKATKSLLKQTGNIVKAADAIYGAFMSGNSVYIFGNGGSAADAQHIEGELLGRFTTERRGLAAKALTTSTSYMTALSNDYPDGFQRIFERQVASLARKGDVLWAISTSGNSENVVRALQKGREIGTYNFSLTGKDGGRVKTLSDLNINITSDNTPRIQEGHLIAYHSICEIIDKYVASER